MGTTVTYNGVTLLNVQTREWNQEVQYDESGTDAMYHVFRMRFEGLLHASESGPASVSTGNATAMREQYSNVYQRILKTRCKLTVSVTEDDNERVLFTCDPCLGDIKPSAYTPAGNPHQDVNNGPKPKSFRVLQVIGSKCLRVAFEIECSKLICTQTYSQKGGAVGKMPIVLNNRWSTKENMDENHFITRTIDGHMRLSAAEASTRITSRHLVIPTLEWGFRRVAVDFGVDKTGLDCTYTITDRQVHTSAPWPATKMSVTHSQSTNEGINVVSEVRVELEGPPFADKKLLLARAIHIIDAKLDLAQVGREFKTRYIPESIVLTDHIGDANRVTAHMRYAETPTTDVPLKEMLAGLRDNMGEPLKLPDVQTGEVDSGTEEPVTAGYDPCWSTPPSLYGYYPPKGEDTVGSERRPSVLLLFSCYLQQPCVDYHGLPKRPVTVSENREEDGRPPYEATEINEGGRPPYRPEGQEKWSEGALDHVYTFGRATTRYTTDQCRVQLPIADDPTSHPSKRNTPTCKVFQLALPQCRRTIDVDYERAGAWPEIPEPVDEFTDGDLHGTLLENWVEACPPGLTADGVTPLYRLTAHLEYALDRPPSTNEKFRIGPSAHTRFKNTDDAVKFRPAEAYKNKEMKP